MRKALISAIGGSLLTLAGCATIENSPTGQAIANLSPGSGKATAEQAENIAFASLALDTATQRGLVVLGAQGGEQTHWPIVGGGFLSLYQGGLYAISTPQGDLLTTHYNIEEAADSHMPWQLTAPAHFSIERHWVDTDNLSHAQRAQGSMQCEKAQRRDMLLTELSLQLCRVTYTWTNGQTTHAQWWRDPSSLRLWEVEESAWPGGPEIGWQVARPWWGS